MLLHHLKHVRSRDPSGPHRLPTRRTPVGAALLMCLFVVFMVSSLVLNVLTTEVGHFTATRNIYDYERALYLANAGVHHACAEILADSSWRSTVTDGSYPADDTYSATATSGTGSQINITSTGVSGDIQRTIQATIEQ